MIHEDQNKQTPVLFATLMDSCKLKHAQLAEHLQTIQRTNRASRRQVSKTTLDAKQSFLNKGHRISALQDCWVFLVTRPNPMLHFAPFLSTHFFPCLNPIFKNGSFLSVVALVSVTLLDSNPRLSAEKRSNLALTPSSSLARTVTVEPPECQERRGAKTI